jgi:acyl carrier protein
MASTTDRVRAVLSQHAKLSVDVATLADNADLYAAGLSSFATVQLMLALEEEFDLEFPDRLLNRRSFESVAAITAVVDSVSMPKTATR